MATTTGQSVDRGSAVRSPPWSMRTAACHSVLTEKSWEHIDPDDLRRPQTTSDDLGPSVAKSETPKRVQASGDVIIVIIIIIIKARSTVESERKRSEPGGRRERPRPSDTSSRGNGTNFYTPYNYTKQ
ncbi:hypothetical protein EYF80_033005 [Liparis tanakae]|uniref:Uncharacterized protein n=1 Tax=Liparis tanakae TaxID=230148 RepID=A0A4Z2GT15_9TELE|nr:hypothetical protein EYF80_033005 [Liparis tanakae]